MRNCRELWTVAGSVVVELEEWDSEELHILWDGENLCARTLDTSQGIRQKGV
jgi:hypothetical protein